MGKAIRSKLPPMLLKVQTDINEIIRKRGFKIVKRMRISLLLIPTDTDLLYVAVAIKYNPIKKNGMKNQEIDTLSIYFQPLIYSLSNLKNFFILVQFRV